MSTEFNLIQKYFNQKTKQTDLGIGDDAALIHVEKSYQLAISSDMLVAGTHFYHGDKPYDIGWKSMAVNLSDMAAMGANPKWATLSIALPEANETWLGEFSRGFFSCADTFNVDLIGGDTTRGPLNISVTILGEVPVGKALRRDNAKTGDDIWVSGTLGDAALGLAHVQNKLHDKIILDDGYIEYCLNALHRPQPRVLLGLALLNLVHSAIDISDGLLSDLGHILKASNVGAEIQLEKLPSSLFISKHLGEKQIQQCILAGGDDYELCFTAPQKNRSTIEKIGEKLHLPITRIGNIYADSGLTVTDKNKQKVLLEKTGYDHFT
jgi:thiamine-monophosphate kinase